MKKENNKRSCHHYNGVRGFTLIEILVVVLIIAVLATIAVSAYQKAVLKSRFSSLMPLAKTLAQGNEEYYLRNGQYTDDVNKLDIRATGNSKTQITLSDEDNHKYVLLTRDDMNNNLRMYQQRSKNFPGETHCEALIDDSLANWLCRDSLKGTLVGNKFGYTVYSLSEETVGSLARTYYDGVGHTGVYNGDNCTDSGSRKCAGQKYENGAVCSGRGGYLCNSSKFADHAMCYGYCSGTSTFTNQSVCVGRDTGSCSAQFSDHSSCVGEYAYNPHAGAACHGANFSDHSACFGVYSKYDSRKENCTSNNFTENSYCVGSAKNTCAYSDFKTGSICYANKSGSCKGNTYDGTSCCAGGENCENVADRCETKKITVPPQPTVPEY